MHNDAVPTNFSTFASFQCVTFIEPGKKLCQIYRPKYLFLKMKNEFITYVELHKSLVFIFDMEQLNQLF